jgi:HAD superfamily hydrolase (TIGR01509 family)
LEQLHSEFYGRRSGEIKPLPGASELLDHLSQSEVPWAIATSGKMDATRPILNMLKLESTATVITRDDVERAKPDPDLFLAAADKLDVAINESFVVGDSVWDLLAAQRAKAIGVGVLSGGNGQNELERAGAYRVFQDPGDLLRHLDEFGLPGPK